MDAKALDDEKAHPLAPELLTVSEAATLLRVSTSTIWRWIDRGILPGYRVGPRRVFVNREDLRPVPLRASESLQAPRKMTRAQQRRALAALDRIRELREQLFAANGYKLFEPEGWQLLNESRDERTRELSP